MIETSNPLRRAPSKRGVINKIIVSFLVFLFKALMTLFILTTACLSGLPLFETFSSPERLRLLTIVSVTITLVWEVLNI